jgi:hypothetical protein
MPISVVLHAAIGAYVAPDDSVHLEHPIELIAWVAFGVFILAVGRVGVHFVERRSRRVPTPKRSESVVLSGLAVARLRQKLD